MAKKDFSNAFAKFANHETKTAYIKALDAEIVYRDLTMAEADAFSKRLIKSYGDNGESPEIDYIEANEIKYEKAALILVDPSMTVDDLKALPATAITAINEINALAEPEKDSEDVATDEEGN